mmetsp:Transcript_23592/g.54902  ORF Transcript_23592/g.54902 Transcript_23592/m.54902 type:complete len:422 (+) Transcript_23592:2439-3704(+)
MKLISEDEPVSWPSEKARRTIETAVFGLLSGLCGSSKGRRAVVSAEQCSACIAHAAHVVESLVEKVIVREEVESAESTDDKAVTEEEGGGDDEEGREDGEMEKSSDLKETKTDASTKTTVRYQVKPHASTPTLESTALGFLANLVGIESCRLQLFREADFIHSLKVLAKDSSAFKLQMQTTHFLANVAPFAKSSDEAGTLTTTDLADAFIAVLKLQPQTRLSDVTAKDNVNTLKTAATKGFGTILADTKADMRATGIEAVAAELTAVVKKYTVSRSSSDKEKANGALLAYNLSVLLLASGGNEQVWGILANKEHVKSMIHLVEWRYDAKATVDEDDQLYWDSAVSNCLQLLSLIICATEERQALLGVSINATVSTILMMARPGKAPRKTADFTTTLKRIVDAKGDASSVLAARRILERISD